MAPHARASIDASRPVRLALDAMSGDEGPSVVVAAARAITQRHSHVSLDLVGDQRVLGDLLGDQPERIDIVHADQVVTMDEPPADALRRKKQSSMRIAINRVKEGEAAACVSAGNTGALMATAKFVLKTVSDIERPAIMAELPSMAGGVYLLDVGANASCSAGQLYQFAVMGSVVAANLSGSAAPRIALLNIGQEDIKGNPVVREAAALIEASGLNYVGFVEGDAVCQGGVDVVVTDGFTGNVALKTMEGTATLITHFLRQSFLRSLWSRLQALVARPSLNHLRATLDPRAYNGASFVGLNGIVIKSHGGADAVAFEHAIETALLEVQDNVPAGIARWLSNEAA
ncbi:MAG: phosphate acyltransferase PlsX [Pseudomonadota bacterium]